MKTKLGYAIVGMVVTLAAIGMPTLNIHTSSAMEEDSFANQNDRQDRFEDRFGDPENPNNDKGNIELWTNSSKNREPC
jgi:hypothetical protein